MKTKPDPVYLALSLSRLRLYFTTFILCILFPFMIAAQDEQGNPYKLLIIADRQEYLAHCEADSNNILIDLALYIPGIHLDIRYATDENFTGEVIYPAAIAYARLPVAKALKRVQADLADQGLGLKIFDAYRPYAYTLKFWGLIHDTLFVAAPWRGSRHNRGCAVDITIIDLESGQELDMPTPYDDFSANASATCSDLPPAILENRDSLIKIMARYGFKVFESEWWHFDFKGWERYPLMDIPFEELVR